MNLRKLGIGFGVTFATVASAWLIGTQAGNLVNESKSKDYQERRQTQTKYMLEQMGTIDVGDTLPNHALEDLNGKIWQLSELVNDYRAIISFFKPDCGACDEQLTEFKESNLKSSKFILISADNPLHLRMLAESEEIESTILYDENRSLTDALAITVSPFNIVVNQYLVIQRIEMGIMMAEELATELVK